MNAIGSVRLQHVDTDVDTDHDTFRSDVIQGLRSSPKELPCKYLYDEYGSRLFEVICQLSEYYLTRTELSIMKQAAGEIVEAIGRNILLIEYGSGSSLKTRLLLDHLQELQGYIPIDISRPQLDQAVRSLTTHYPWLRVWPVCGDFTRPYELPSMDADHARRVVFFPGSTIGNFVPGKAVEFLRQMTELIGPGGGLLIGVDLKKDPRLLSLAYNDQSGVTAEFNLNLLRRINRELEADFELGQFSHYAFYNPGAGRIEMHLVSLTDQVVTIQDDMYTFTLGETIWTESSYKYSIDEFTRLAASAGFHSDRVWTDVDQLFSVHYLTVEG